MVAPAPVRTTSPIVLIVDDDAESSEMYSLYLNYAGIRVAHAHTSKEAVAVAVASNPDQIVTDMVLPREDARELYQKLRREEATRQIPIVTVTARVEDVADTRLLKDAGVEAVLLKPCEPTRLLAEIRRILEQSRSLREHAMQLRARADEVQTRAMTLYDRSRPQQARKRTRLEAQAAEIAQRIRGEFREMQGLQLTLAQAARLWDVDRDTCQRILDGLVAEKFLAVRTGRYFMIAS